MNINARLVPATTSGRGIVAPRLAKPAGPLRLSSSQCSWGRCLLSHSARSTGLSRRALKVFAVRDGAVLDRPLRVAVVGGGPGGASTADTLAKGGIETYLFERKLDNCKVSTLLYC